MRVIAPSDESQKAIFLLSTNVQFIAFSVWFQHFVVAAVVNHYLLP